MKLLKIVLGCFAMLFMLTSATQAQPDLVVSNISLVNVPIYKRTYSGRTIKLPVRVTIRNIGRTSIRSNFDFQLTTNYSSKFGTIRGGLARFQSKTVTVYINVRSKDMLRYVKFTAYADRNRTTDDVYSGKIRELRENNNSRSRYLKIPKYIYKPSHGGGGVIGGN